MNNSFLLEHCMRWYGPQDPVRLQDLAQAGCTSVVSALHDIAVGEVWPAEAISHRKAMIQAADMDWTVVESLPVHEDIKTGSGQLTTYIENYQASIRNLASQGIKVITYNFMPVLDWVRTNTAYRLPNGAETLRFDRLDFLAFDLFMLQRPGAADDYPQAEITAARAHFETMDEAYQQQVFRNALLGLPGSDVPFQPDEVLSLLEQYQGIGRDRLKANLFQFLRSVAPVAEEVGIQLAIHPDDPPYSVLGLPRVMNTEADIAALVEAVPNPANGLCFCSGSFGARPDNDLPAMLRRWGSRVYFLHLRNTKRDEQGNFTEANHLEGDTDMYQLMNEIVALQQREQRSIPMRPDHGFKIMDDLAKTTYPGYSAIGRLKGLAELRGLEYGLSRNYLSSGK